MGMASPQVIARSNKEAGFDLIIKRLAGREVRWCRPRQAKSGLRAASPACRSCTIDDARP